MEDSTYPKGLAIHVVGSPDSAEFAHLSWALTRSSIVALDAEWKPVRRHQQDQPSSFPTVTLLQLACRLSPLRGCDSVSGHHRNNKDGGGAGDGDDDSVVVFLLDLVAVPLDSIYELLKDVFTSPNVLKLGFRFKQDLVYLSSTFTCQCRNEGFNRVEPFIDITSIYSVMRHKQLGRKIPKESKSLATICDEVLGISLSKELQCSDWSQRPLTEDQKLYAAADAHCLLKIFSVFETKFLEEGDPMDQADSYHSSNVDLGGLKGILGNPDFPENVFRSKILDASNIVQASVSGVSQPSPIAANGVAKGSCKSMSMGVSLLKLVGRYGDKLLLKESDRKPKVSKKKGKRLSSTVLLSKEKQCQNYNDWQGPPPWDLSLGGDGCAKFLCDVMVEGLAKHLRCVGIDAAIPLSRKPEPRELLAQAERENRVLLTRDAKLLQHNYLIHNQIYRVMTLRKNEQLLEVIQTFQLNISEDQLMSRCTKCNGRFIQKPLTTEEAVEASKGFQIIPNCLFKKNLEFWQCLDCNQLYWEGTQYHNAVQKFVNICNLKLTE